LKPRQIFLANLVASEVEWKAVEETRSGVAFIGAGQYISILIKQPSYPLIDIKKM
jgi:hypothetical protein